MSMIEQVAPSFQTSEPLVDWKNPPTLLALKQDYQDAKPSHDAQVSKIDTWLDNLNVKGSAAIKKVDGNSSIAPKLIRKQAEWRYAALSEPFLSTPDLFNVNPVTWEDRDAAKQNQLILNHQVNVVIDKTTFIDEVVRTAVDEGTVIVRTGWEFAEEEYEDEEPVYEFFPNPEIVPLLQQLAEMQKENPTRFEIDIAPDMKASLQASMENNVPLQARQVGVEKVTKFKTLYNRPTLEVCDYRNVTIDPTALNDIDKANFVIYSFESSLAQLEKDGRYKNLDKINIDASSVLGQPDHSTESNKTFNFADKPRKKFVVYEYWGFWDIDGTGMVKPIVAAWVGDTLIRMEENPFPDKKLPFTVISYLPVRRSMYGEPDGALLEDNQKVVGAVTRGMIDILGKSANGQTGIRKDMLDVTNRRKFERGLDYEFNPTVDPRQGIYMHTYPEIPNSAQFMLQLQNMEAESLTGVKSFAQGVSGQSLGQVAAGIRGALDAASKRELGILRRLSNGILKIGRKIVSMNSEFLSDKEVIRITNEEFIQIDRQDLAGDFDIRLSISTAEEDNNKAQELAFMLQTMGNTMPPEMSKMILGDIARLRKMPDLAKKIESYSPEPDPMDAEMHQLEMAKIQAEIALLQAQAQSFISDAQLKGSKVGTEVAKADHLQSQADQKTLDFVEQEKGIKHQRAIQMEHEKANKKGEQAYLEHEMEKDRILMDNAIKGGNLNG